MDDHRMIFTDEFRVLDRHGKFVTTVEAPDANTLAYWDRTQLRRAPHQLVRVALIPEE